MPVKNIMEVFKDVIQHLESESIPYMVVGSVASMIYGEARMTRDMDIVIDIAPESLGRFESLFPFEKFYCPPTEILRQELSERGQFNLIHHDSGLKIDVVIRKDSDHGRTEFARKKRLPFWEGFGAFVASPEDVILKKLVFYREGESQKHLTDIRGILAETQVDKHYLDEWLDKLGLKNYWAKI